MLIVLKLDPEHCVGQSLKDLGHDFYRFFLRHRSSRTQLCLYWQTSDSSTPLKQMPSRDASSQAAAIRESTDSASLTSVRTSGPSSVMAIVCSTCALGWPS